MTILRASALALAALLLLAGSAHAGQKLKVRTTNPDTGKALEGVYLRSNVKSYNSGLLRPQEQFFALGSRGGYVFGYAYGDFRGCAFVARKYLTTTVRTFPYAPPGCGTGDAAHAL